MMEAARRIDEQRRYVSIFRDPYQLLGVKDLPDPDEPLSEEERELFGIIDGNHTLVDILAEAPLSEYETYEALQRMMDSRWIVFEGRRDPGAPVPPPVPRSVSVARATHSIARELAVAAVVVVVLGGLRLASAVVQPTGASQPAEDVYATAQVRDVRYALDLYRRERGRYPERLGELVEDRWISADQTHLPGYRLTYKAAADGQEYKLVLR